MNPNDITRAELLRQRIRDVQDLAAELGARATVNLACERDLPDAFDGLQREHVFESTCLGRVSECESFEFVPRDSDHRGRVVFVVTKRTRPAKEAV